MHSAEFLGLAATGKPIQFDGIEVYQMRNGRMAAHWNVVALWSFYRQVSSQSDGERGARAESENKRLITRYYEEVLNQGKLDVLDAIARSDHVEHNPFPGQAQGLEGLKQRVGIIRPSTPSSRSSRSSRRATRWW